MASGLLLWRHSGGQTLDPSCQTVSALATAGPLCLLHQCPSALPNGHPGRDPVVDQDLEGYINIPTVNIGGVQDSLLKYSHRVVPIVRSHPVSVGST